MSNITTKPSQPASVARPNEAAEYAEMVACSALSEIADAAKLAMPYLKRADSPQHIEVVASALRLIWSRSEAARHDLRTQAAVREG